MYFLNLFFLLEDQTCICLTYLTCMNLEVIKVDTCYEKDQFYTTMVLGRPLIWQSIIILLYMLVLALIEVKALTVILL